jgi:hypothetical protein
MLSKPVNGAWEEIESVNKPVNGAWQECEVVCKPVNGAWQEVWSNGVRCAFITASMHTDTSTYSYEVLDGGKTLSYNITNVNASALSSNMMFRIKKASGFGNTIKVKYTLTQTVNQAMGSVFFATMTQQQLNRDSRTFYNYFPCSGETFEDTVTVETAQDYIYLFVDAYSSNGISGTITDLYINDEPVRFID